MTKVAMFVTNPCTHDARVMKEAESLADAGFEVRVYALSNAHSPEGIFQQHNYSIHRLKYDSVFVRARRAVWKVLKVLLFPFYLLRLLLVKLANQFRTYASPGLVRWYESLMSGVLRILNIKQVDNSQSSVNTENGEGLRVSQIPLFKPLFFVYRLLKRSYARIKSWGKKKVNRAIYVVLLPIHKLTTYYFFCKEASKQACIWDPDVVHAHDLNTMYAAKLVKDKNNSTLFYDSHELWIHRNRVNRRATMEKILDTIVERILIKHADAVITVCDSIGDWLVKQYPNIPKPVILRNIPYTLESENLQEQTNSPGLKQRIGLSEKDILIIYTGKFTTGRGIELGLEATKSLDNLHFALLGYGEESYVAGLQKRVDNLGIGGRVHFFDPVPHKEVPGFISGADFALVYIEPICLSYEYALPNKLFESIQANIPIMGVSLTEIRKIIENNKIGLCFNSVESFRSALKSVTPEKVAIWKDNILECKRDLCWEVESKKLLELYTRFV